jgi:PAS domain S-box-containing protein
MFDENGIVDDIKIIEINEIGVKYINDKGEEIKNKTGRQLISDFSLNNYKNIIDVALTGESENIEKYNQLSNSYVQIYMYSPQKNRTAVIIEDITVRKQMEESLRENGNQMRTLINAIPDYIWMKNKQNEYVFCNNHMEQLLGQSESTVIGKTNYEILPKEISDTFKETDIIIYSTKKTHSFEKNITLPQTGINIILEGIKVPLFDSEGEIYSIIGIARNITERKQTQDALFASEERFNILSSFASEALVIHKDGIVLDANRAFAQMIGFDNPIDVIGKNGLRMIPLTKESKLSIIENNEKKSEAKYVIEFKKNDGKIIFVEYNAKDVIFKGIHARLVLFHDITDIITVQNELKDRNLFIESILNLNPDMLYVYDLVEKKNIFSNKGIQRILGFSSEEIKEMGNQCIPVLMHPDDFNQYLQKIVPRYNTAKDGEQIVHQYRMKDKGGKWHILESLEIIYQRQADDKPRQILGYGKDITERKLLEQQMLHSVIDTEESERLHFSQELHDGITPLLSASKMYVQWLNMPNINANKNDIIKDIESLLDESIQTIRDISFKLSPHILRNYGLYDAIKAFVDKINNFSNIHIDINTDKSIRMNEKSETIVYRILCECINNSIKHSSASLIKIDMHSINNSILDVIYFDNGYGFDVEKTLSEHKGIGLLNIQSRLKSINGTMNVKSSYKGTIFHFQFKIQESKNSVPLS